MKRLYIFCCCFLFLVSANAQSDSLYQTLIAKAGLLHLQQDHKNAIKYYEQAFQIQKPDALTAYKAAGMYSLDSNANLAFHYLQLALDSGWTEADWLAFDPYFDYLKKNSTG
jgi:tetratricopeptide (TPR) repeat protein